MRVEEGGLGTEQAVAQQIGAPRIVEAARSAADIGLILNKPTARRTPRTAPAGGRSLGGPIAEVGRRLVRRLVADEQKHWYEELGFSIEVDCVRCVPCRKQEQGIARQRERYQRLFHVEARTPAENLEMAECCLGLVEAGVFDRRQTAHVRKLLNGVPRGARGIAATGRGDRA